MADTGSTSPDVTEPAIPLPSDEGTLALGPGNESGQPNDASSVYSASGWE